MEKPVIVFVESKLELNCNSCQHEKSEDRSETRGTVAVGDAEGVGLVKGAKPQGEKEAKQFALDLLLGGILAEEGNIDTLDCIKGDTINNGVLENGQEGGGGGL